MGERVERMKPKQTLRLGFVPQQLVSGSTAAPVMQPKKSTWDPVTVFQL